MLVSDIFREIQRTGTSFSLARAKCTLGEATLNGNKIDFFSDVDVNEGDVLSVTQKDRTITWTFREGSWRK